MKQKALIVAALAAGVCFFSSSNALALQSATRGILLPCGQSGVLFTNGSNQPTSIDLAADWSGTCPLTLSWIDASGNSQRITLAAPPHDSGPSSSYQPSGGAFSSLKGDGTISWTTGPAAPGPNILNVELERTPSSLKKSGGASNRPSNRGSATIGSVGGMFGAAPGAGINSGEDMACGSSGSFFTNLTSAPVTFDLMITNQSPIDNFGSTIRSCNVTITWTDASGAAQTLTPAEGGVSQGVVSTSLPAGGTIAWSSSATSPLSSVSVQWQVEPAVEFRP